MLLSSSPCFYVLLYCDHVEVCGDVLDMKWTFELVTVVYVIYLLSRSNVVHRSPIVYSPYPF